MNRRAFTLIELMIVVAIVGILSAIAFPKFAEVLRKSNEGATKGSLGALRSSLTIYYSDLEGQYPDALDALTVSGKYLAALPATSVAPYHDRTSAATASPAFPGTEDAGWWYDNAAGTGAYGSVFVNCSHTDTRGGVWSSF